MTRIQAQGSGLSAERLERMRAVMTRDVEQGAAPGLIYAVSRRGEAHVEAVGMMAFDGNEPMQRDTVFRFGYGIIFALPGSYPIQQAIEESGAFPDVAGGGIPSTLPPDELMAAYGRLPLLHQPGEQYLYNSGSDILGVLLARASDMSLGEISYKSVSLRRSA